MPKRTIQTAEELNARVRRLSVDIAQWREDQRTALAAKTEAWNIHRSD